MKQNPPPQTEEVATPRRRAQVGSQEELISRPFDAPAPQPAAGRALAVDEDGERGADEIIHGPWDGLGDVELMAGYPLDELVAALDAGAKTLRVTGAPSGLQGMLLTQLHRKTGQRIVAIVPTLKDAQQLAGDIAVFAATPFGREVLAVPTTGTSPYGDVSPDRDLTFERMAALFCLHMDLGGDLIVLPVSALARRTVPAEVLLELSDSVAVGQEVSNAALRRSLTDCGFSAVSLVEDRGTFAIRGDIVDIWSPLDPTPVRIERWGDEVTSIKTFDPASQRTQEALGETFIFPVREILCNDRTLACARGKLRALGDRCEVPSKAVSRVLDDIQAGVHFLGIETLLPAFYDQLGAVFDLLPDDALTVLIEPDQCDDQLARLWTSRADEYARRRQEQRLTFEPEAFYLSIDEIKAWLASRPQTIRFETLLIDTIEGSQEIRFKVRSNLDVVRVRKEKQGAEGAVHALAEMMPIWRERYGRITFVCETTGESQRMLQLLGSYGQKAELLQSPLDPLMRVNPPCSTIGVVTGVLSEGFRSPAISAALVAGHEVFGHKATRRASTRTFQETASISSFRDLSPGDLVVHTEFGIGKYAGLHKMTVGGVPNDFLLIEYSGRDKLYLPVYKLGRVQKFIGGDKNARLDKMGGAAWEKIKEKVKAELTKLAVDLIALYARRQTLPGVQFPPPDAYFNEFEAAFPFEETPDQLTAIEDTLADMSRATVADRLICGDVGFGKTEVAMRAAFLAVLAGKQVGVLVPTTVLCEQHLASFRARFSGYPVRVEAINRFRSRKDIAQIIEETRVGKVDILIGTHRLLSKDVGFRDLGLLIVDEEQRFGVGHKEKLKALKSQVDCVTMSATPIPRTLQMSLLGIRDMSIIASPPPGRLAVRTHIARYGDNVIREAIMRELGRGGQVYFVHNRVETIQEVAASLREIVPEARIGVGHGQMKEGDLEEVMLRFVKGEFNVLLCTTIIESGLDIANANTMLIDRADTFGLSQLYQLRGRIGRSSRRAYCYLMVRGKGKMTAIAQERLEVIERFTALGSGFHVASYDLEIRGAGNILGPQQSGNIASVGLELYSELLEEAIHEVKGEEVQREIEPEVNIPIPAFLPDTYIHDISLRLLFYKRLSLARSEEELADLYTELVDRFGAPPPEVDSLRDVISIKIALRRLRCPRLDAGVDTVHLTLGDSPAIQPHQAIGLIQAFRGRYALTPAMKLIRTLKPTEAQGRLKAALLVCREVLDAAGL